MVVGWCMGCWGGGAVFGVVYGVVYGVVDPIAMYRVTQQQHFNRKEDEPVLERHERVEPLVPERPDFRVHDHRKDRRRQTHEEERRLVREHHREARQREASRHVGNVVPPRNL